MKATDIKKVACAATGVIGSSWATNFAMKGYPVNVYDISEEKLESSRRISYCRCTRFSRYIVCVDCCSKKVSF